MMNVDLNTILLLLILGVLAVFAFRRPAGADRGSLVGDEQNTQGIRAAESGNAIPPAANESSSSTCNPINQSAIRELFEIEVVHLSPTAAFVEHQQSGPASSCLQLFGELIKGTGNFRQAGQAFKICFKPEVERGLRSGTYELMHRVQGSQLTAVDAANKIVGNGWIEPARAQQLVALTSLAWQGMAIVTAQKFLADINRSLGEMKASIDELKHLHDAEIEGRLIGWQSYIQQAAERLASNVNETEKLAIAIQLEQIHRMSLEEYFAAEDRLNRKIEELGHALKDKKAKKSTVQEMQAKCVAVDREASRLLAFARINIVNMLAQSMRLDFGAEVVLRDNPKLLEESLNEVAKELDAAIEKAKALPTGFWDVETDASKNRQMIDAQISALRSKLREQQFSQLQMISSARARLETTQAFYFRVGENGQIGQIELSKTAV